jgi:hypothetical protein
VSEKKRVIISEDWWAVLVGLGLILLVKIGLLGELLAIPWPLFK